jgi:PAS domain S-box-containing protein
MYVRAEKRIDHANDIRHSSYQLVDELRHSSDDLTRMARTYVVTGERRYKKQYQDILDIRDGIKARPREYSSQVYWDLIVDDTKPPRPDTPQAISLLNLMRQNGFTELELGKLTEAKLQSDLLASIELKAMQLSETRGVGAGESQALARKMLYDQRYHLAKASIMKPINEFVALMKLRTDTAVKTAEKTALLLRILFISFAVWLLLLLWLSHRKLRKTLGGRLDEVYEHIARIGRGDFSTIIRSDAARQPSIMAWLGEMQTKLQRSDHERTKTEKALQNHLTTLTQPLENSDGIRFTDLFDIDELQHIQDAFADATGVASIITATDGTPLTKPSNFCRLCSEIIRTSEKGRANCIKSDRELGKYNPDAPIVQPCLSGGLWDGGASITVGGRHIANWLIGQVRNDDLNEAEMLKYADEIGVERAAFKSALSEVPVMAREQFEKVALALFLLVNELSSKAYQNLQQARYISERSVFEAELKESEFSYRTLADSGQALIWKARTDKLCDYFNKVWLDFTGRTHEQEFGNGWAEGVHPEDLRRCIDIYVGSFDRREPFSMDYRLRRHDGVYRWIQDDGCPRYDVNGNFIGYIGYCLDITDRKLVEAALNGKNSELERFTYTVSHDLKSPLITIQSYAGMIEKDLEAGKVERARKDLKRIEAAAAGMSELLNDLLELSRVGKQMNIPSRIDMNGLVAKVLQQLAGPLKQVGVKVVVQPELPAAFGDGKRIAEVVQNLVENALKYGCDREEPSLEIGARMEEPDCIYFVRDNGKGIDPCFHESIFNIFTKLDAASPGTGVGLALVKRIIEVHNGRIWVESAGSGHGSCFCFTLPGRGSSEQPGSQSPSGETYGP